MKKIILRLGVVLIIALTASTTVLSKEVSWTLEDRERLIRMEERIATLVTKDELRQEINGLRLESRADMRWGFGILFSGMIALVGFVLWDRRSAEEREKRLERVLKEYALKNTELRDIMRQVGFV